MAKRKNKNLDDNIYEFYSTINDSIGSFAGLYIDFDNLWNAILDLIPELKTKNEKDEKILQKVENKFNEILNEILRNLQKEKIHIRFIKAYSDFSKLPYSNKINIIDILHKKGIKTIYPYVKGNKDMSDRALIIGVIEDIFFSENIDLIFVLTGDIDYLPLFEFISGKTDKDFYLISFKSKFNTAYNKIFYLNDKILFIDELLKINSHDMEYNKKVEIVKEFLKEKNLDIEKGIKYKETIDNLNSYYYCKFDEKLLQKIIKHIKEENND